MYSARVDAQDANKVIIFVLYFIFFLQGGVPTPFDRNFGTKLGVKSVLWLTERMRDTTRQGRVVQLHPPQSH